MLRHDSILGLGLGRGLGFFGLLAQIGLFALLGQVFQALGLAGPLLLQLLRQLGLRALLGCLFVGQPLCLRVQGVVEVLDELVLIRVVAGAV